MSDETTSRAEHFLREQFHPDALRGPCPARKHVRLVGSNTIVGKPPPPRPTPALVLLKGGKED